MDDIKVFGEYKIYKNDILISSKKNSLSKAGRLQALRCLTGDQTVFAQKMVVGIGNEANTFESPNLNNLITNTRLSYEVRRDLEVLPAWKVYTADEASKIVFMSFLDNNVEPKRYIISEMGLYAQSESQSRELSTFNSNTYTSESISVLFKSKSTSTNEIALSSTNSSAKYVVPTTAGYESKIRFGSGAIEITRSCSLTADLTTNIKIFDDANTFPQVNDRFILAYNKSNTSAHIMHLKIWSGEASLRYAIDTGALSGNIVHSIDVNSPTQYSSGITSVTQFDWSSIKRVEIASASANTGGANIILDGLKYFKAGEIDARNGLLSRAVLASPITKNETDQFRIEYHLNFGFNEGL